MESEEDWKRKIKRKRRSKAWHKSDLEPEESFEEKLDLIHGLCPHFTLAALKVSWLPGPQAPSQPILLK